MIRPAVIEDIPEITRMYRSFYEEARLLEFGVAWAGEALALQQRQMIENPAACIFLACDEGKVVGMLVALEQPMFGLPTQHAVVEQIWWVDKEYRGTPHARHLLGAFEHWGKERGAFAAIIALTATELRPALERFYRRCGFRHLESHFLKEL